MDLAVFAVTTAHLLLAAVWLGAMSYSLGVVQPRLVQWRGSPQAAEEPATVLASGARWKVVGLLAALAVTGVLLVALLGDDRGRGWWALVGVKAALLLAASAVFWHVSWRMWPRRVFALPPEVPGHQAAFRRVGALLVVLAGSATVLGVAAGTLARP